MLVVTNSVQTELYETIMQLCRCLALCDAVLGQRPELSWELVNESSLGGESTSYRPWSHTTHRPPAAGLSSQVHAVAQSPHAMPHQRRLQGVGTEPGTRPSSGDLTAEALAKLFTVSSARVQSSVLTHKCPQLRLRLQAHMHNLVCETCK